ncbi:hypothetical protein K502DRAFT_326485, partial [Neoconidiobolus thromboides FSU 785]
MDQGNNLTGDQLQDDNNSVGNSSIESASSNKSNTQQALTEKQKYILEIRKKFCIRKEFSITQNIIHEDGTLNQNYFLPKLSELQSSHQLQMEQMKLKTWTEESRKKLILGIEQFGIGNFKLIADAHLPDWSVNELRLKACRLIGRQNLQLYKNFKGNEAEILKEWKFNHELGIKYNCWKNSVLVYDDQGVVLNELLKYHDQL